MEEELPEPKLQQPEEIAAFEVTDPSGNTFKFSGGNFSTELYQLSMCGLSAGTIMEHFGAEHIPTLKDHRALTELALAAIEGKDTEADEKTRNQALSIFYNSILLAYASRTPSGGFGITGERTRDVFSLRNATVDGDYITVDWLVDPVQVKYGDNNYGYECSKRILTKIPSIQGTVVATDDGLYNPETGMPFSVTPSHVGVNPLLHDYINQKIIEWGDANRDGIQKAFDTADRNMPELLNPMMLGMTFNLFPE